MPGERTELLGIDRRAEHDAALAARRSASGRRSRRSSSRRAGWCGASSKARRTDRAHARARVALRRVAQSLSAVHAGPPIPSRFDSSACRGLPRLAGSRRRIPDAFGRAGSSPPMIERTRRAAPERRCHNDLLNANFIDDGTRMRIVAGSTRAWATWRSISRTSP